MKCPRNWLNFHNHVCAEKKTRMFSLYQPFTCAHAPLSARWSCCHMLPTASIRRNMRTLFWTCGYFSRDEADERGQQSRRSVEHRSSCSASPLTSISEGEVCKPPGFWATALSQTHTHKHIHPHLHPPMSHPLTTPPPNPQRTRYQLGWALLHRPDIHTGLEGGAAAGWKYGALWFTVRDTQRIRIRLFLFPCLLFLSVCLCLCVRRPYMHVCPSSVSACRDDYHWRIIPPNDGRLTPTSPVSLPARSVPSPCAVIALASVRVS